MPRPTGRHRNGPTGPLAAVLGAGLVAHALPSVGVVAAIAGTRSPCRVGPMWLHRGPDQRAVALTFDDGPSPETTPRVVRQLGRLGLRATFFVTGTEAAKYPGLIAQIEAAGHAVESHGMEHRHHLAHGPRWILEDTRAALDTLHHLGVTPRYLRPPYGQATTATLVAARRYGLTPVLWSCWGREFAEPLGSSVATRVRRGLVPGSVVLLHDSDRHCGVGSVAAVEEALVTIAEDLRRSGLGTLTVAELLS